MKEDLKILTVEEWEKVKKESLNNNELIVFKFSPICPTSFSVQRKFDAWYEALPGDSNIKCARVNVIAERPVSRHVEHELKIVHQSPQIIWLGWDGKVKWHGSHYNITEKKLDEALKG